MEYLISILFGYLLGSVSPAALIGRLKKTDLRSTGTGNLGATNTALTFGKKLGIMVMVFDVAKGIGATLFARFVFERVSLTAAILAGSAAVVGHMFPFYMKFKGGKGLATYGGMVLAMDPVIFLILLCLGVVCMFLFNRGVAVTIEAAILFPILLAIKHRTAAFVVPLTVIASLISLLLLYKHRDNIVRSFKGNELTTRQFFKKVFGRKRNI